MQCNETRQKTNITGLQKNSKNSTKQCETEEEAIKHKHKKAEAQQKYRNAKKQCKC